MDALSDAKTRRGGKKPPYIGLTSSVFPEVRGLRTGVSVRYAQDAAKEWFVMRVSYGRVRKACEMLERDAEEYYLPLHHVIKIIGGRKKRVLKPWLPNFLFVYAEREYVSSLVADRNSCLTFYYNHFRVDRFGKNPPLTVDYDSMMSFIKATSVDNEHSRIVAPQSVHYKSGDKVRIMDGEFQGVEGRVARVTGQQRVVVELDGLCLFATAYIPTAFLKPIHEG